ncbi:MAG: carboxylesterase family protein [bacterium]|nr:carboxylesterase family protein [bacterium]MCP5070085.1 carboxylesterase family protein [bacterium]
MGFVRWIWILPLLLLARSSMLLLVCSSSLLLACSSGPAPEAGADFTSLRKTPSGPVVGFTGSYGSHVWLGLPFAQAPVGNLRWRAPQAHPTWSKPRQALSFGASCVQFASELGGELSADPGDAVGDEDCLFLNVYAPRNEDAAAAARTKRPVLFWIHGGGNTIGTSAFYDGGRLAAEEDVVVVTVNYRLGAFGWFRNPALREGASQEEASGNFALLDLAAALGWVRDHIGSFGGDPGNVTIFGESAGGHNVLMLYTSPIARGLFHRAIVQSGGTWIEEPFRGENPVEADLPGHEKSSTEIALARLVADNRAEDRDGAKQVLAEMTQPELAAFLRGQQAYALLGSYEDGGIGMYDMPKPFADGVVLPEDGIRGALERPDGHADVPIMLGTNRDEDKLFLFFDPEYVDLWFGIWPVVKDEERYLLTAEYMARRWKASGVDELAEILAPQQPGRVFGYRFDWDEEPTLFGKNLGQLLGAAHGFEIPFVFGHWELGPQGGLLFDEENLPSREALSATMRSYWTEFAKTGAPGLGRQGGLPAWTAWDPDEAGDKWMRLDSLADDGLGMARELETAAGIVQDLQTDTRFTDPATRCEVAEAMFAWGNLEPDQLEAVGCSDPAASD